MEDKFVSLAAYGMKTRGIYYYDLSFVSWGDFYDRS